LIPDSLGNQLKSAIGTLLFFDKFVLLIQLIKLILDHKIFETRNLLYSYILATLMFSQEKSRNPDPITDPNRDAKKLIE
jgi:hypothetical protein